MQPVLRSIPAYCSWTRGQTGKSEIELGRKTGYLADNSVAAIAYCLHYIEWRKVREMLLNKTLVVRNQLLECSPAIDMDVEETGSAMIDGDLAGNLLNFRVVRRRCRKDKIL